MAAWMPSRLPAADSSTTPPPSDAEVLLQLFQEKGLLSPQDVEKTREELARRAAQTPASAAQLPKIKLADWIQNLTLHGDARLRFESRSGEGADRDEGDRMERDRWRYRFRLGGRLEFTDHLRAGLRVDSGPGGRSANVTFGEDAGPWGKGSDGLYLGLVYLNWTPTRWFGATAGRQENPFTTTSLVWDPDLAPEGLSQSFITTAGRVDLFATFGQFVYDEASPDNPFGAGGVSDAYLFLNQVGARFNFRPDLSAQVAPLLQIYSGEGDSYPGPFVGTTPANSTAINDLLVLEVPVEVTFKVGTLPARIFGDFAVNLEGDARARAAGTPQYDDEIYAWQAGAEIGSTRKKGGWSLRAFYQATGLYALDPNLVDTDTFDSRLNLRGFAVQGAYALTDFAHLTLTYAHADRNNKSLPTGAGGDLGGTAGTAFLQDYQIFQADLNFRF